MEASRAVDRQRSKSEGECSFSSETNLRDYLVSPSARSDRLIAPPEPSPGIEHAYQWFGVDIGGTLVKCVYFETYTEPVQVSPGEREGVEALKQFIKSSVKYGSTGTRDERLEVTNVRVGQHVGTLHFLKFATCRMDGFFDMVTKNGLSRFPKVVCATGGGAFKFELDFKQRLGINLKKFDELASLIRGVHFMNSLCPDECYFWKDPTTELACRVTSPLGVNPYPYIIVNIGSGVSILLVESFQSFRRIGGTSVGGGTFLGLCTLLTGTDSFEDAIALAEQGDSHRVDKLVRDIYGGDYDALGLTGDVVASSFGHMTNPDRRRDARPEDLAKAALVTVTNNISAIARMCASISVMICGAAKLNNGWMGDRHVSCSSCLNENVEKVLFVGNYLCGNKLSMEMLAYAMEYWSRGNTTVRALFLQHEGYFGALGSMLFHLEPTSDNSDQPV